MTYLQEIRMKLADPIRDAYDTKEGDGTTPIFDLAHRSIISYTVTVSDVLQVENTDYTMNTETGSITFLNIPADGAEIKCQYTFATFTTNELEDIYLEQDSDVDSTIAYCIEVLLMDSARRFDYTSGQTDMKPSQVFDHLLKMKEIYSGKSDVPMIYNRTNPYYTDETIVTTDISREDV